MNRLGSATSPYLLQHASNPVDWWQWGGDALAEAQRRDVPVLISVGYSACHWCHVMAHESFEDNEIGALINEKFVAIKVDREERPDVDAVYMQATQAMTGQGGWPMTVFATPEGRPFYCGTYFPKEQFRTLIGAVDEAWRTQRDAIEQQGVQVVETIAGTPLKGETEITTALLDHSVELVLQSYDQVHGGFGGAPKFPPHMLMLFMIRGYQRTAAPETLEVTMHTAEAMARGGLYDQLAGGFHRYTVDDTWTVPHFEKMLYDNALLTRVYAELWRVTKNPFALRVALETAEFMMTDLLTAEGGFASALDADTDGVEGLTYAWNRQQLWDVTGDDRAADLLGVTEGGNFEHGLSVLRLMRDIDEATPELKARWLGTREKLKQARDERPQPARDDKVVASWNGLAITALVELARLSKRDDIKQAAIKAGELLANVHVRDGRIKRVSKDGKAGEPDGVLEDYGCVAEAFCALHQLTNDGRWLDIAKTLLDTAIGQFGNGEGGFFDTAADAEKLVTRPADPTDNATPSGLSSLVNALLSYTALSNEPAYHETAQRALESTGALLAKYPRFAGYAASAAEALLSGPVEIAITGDETLYETALMNAPGGAVIINGQPDQPGVPLLAGRTLTGAAYVCRGFVCDRPVTSSVELTTMLRPAD